MRVIKHGNKYELGVVICNNCNCKFAITSKDITKIQYTDYSSYDHDEYDINVTFCPECNEEIKVNIGELKV